MDRAPLISVNAEMTGQYDLRREVAIAQWSIDRNRVAYQKADSHTLSLYLAGGDTSYREDLRDRKGRAGILSLMPEGHMSRWEIGGRIDFAHLYFSDQVLKQFAGDHFDRDVRLFELMDLTYQDDPELRHLMQSYIQNCQDSSGRPSLLGEQLFYQILAHLLTNYNSFNIAATPIRGGLSLKHARLIRAVIQDQLATPLSIAGLASLVGLSPFHFARQFKESFGEAPAQYICRQRVEAVKELLSSGQSLADIAAQTGFAQQSHMTQQFKRHTGLTPAAYRRLISA